MKEELKNRILEDILKLVSIESITGSKGIKNCQQAVIEIANRLGFVSSIHAGGQVIIIEPINNTPSFAKLGIVVHLDTVPYNASEWKHNPLGEIDNNRIYGRGIVDDKAAIVLAMYALYMAKPHFNWQIIVGSCEEGIWTDMQDYLLENPSLPEFLVTIDGNGVQNGCRGYLDLELRFKNTQNLFIYVPNAANNTVPGIAKAIVGNKKISVKGKAVHSSVPQNGINALTKLCHCIMAHINEPNGFFKLMGILNYSYNASYIGFQNHSNNIGKQFVGITSVCPTNCWTDEDNIFVNLNLRLNPRVDKNEVNTAIRHISQHFGCETKIVELTLPSYIPVDSKPIQKMLFAYEHVMGKSTESTFAMGVGYNAALPNCAIFGPQFAAEHDEEDTCHAADESRRIEDIFKFFDMLQLFISIY